MSTRQHATLIDLPWHYTQAYMMEQLKQLKRFSVDSMAPKRGGIILQVYVSNLFYELISWAVPFKLVLDKCHRTHMMISQHWVK